MSDKNIKILLAYLLGWLSGIIIYIIEKNDKEVRKHALQSIIIFGTLSILGLVLEFFAWVIPFFSLLNFILNIIGTILWIYFIVVSIQGKAKIFSFLENFIESKV